MNLAHRAFIVVGSALALLAACTTNVTNNGASSSGSAPVATADCTSRCQTKATGCQASASQAQQACATVCDGSYTGDQLACLEAKPCAQLQGASLTAVCPASSTGTSSGTSGGTSGSSGSTGTTTKFSCKLNGTCYKCNDSAGVSKCSVSTGPGPGCTQTASSYCN